ncbi:mannitol dehydrogenase family protein [Rhodococcus sp. SORGH_AS_0301]|uniref:mannitol dehydrogenase family protein n=1 Tax=Rhodococcus sp. SORGH_AS_0301 TaxID=3041780 RepID=UPI00278644CE|nr:mannitol dehydrogenase family protein [Rhodococcus sp. SORGH_AS_0301]MDQ1182277.1 mannitol 2-dehydrogenase [Rhodococcus sp. SORGH_AS_0301]
MTISIQDALTAPPAGVTVPRHRVDGSTLVCGIVHIGVGAFHRAHEAMYVDRLLAAGHLGWAICGVGVMPADAAARDTAAAQDQLYTLSTVHPDGAEDTRIVGSIARYLYAPDDPDLVVATLAAPTTHIVSLTITESGYGIDDATGAFDPRDDATRHDLMSLDAPVSVLGFLTVALRRRRDEGTAPFTVMACDNIVGNGAVARAALVSFARHHDGALADWIDDSVAFPNSMVDRITPATSPAVIDSVRRRTGIDDAWPVRSESFAQWALEDDFSDGRPPFEDVGVQVVTDVAPFERMKLRLLNASHQMLGYLGVLAGKTFVHEVMADPDLGAFVASYMSHEAAPTVGLVPGVDLDTYIDDLLARFGSPAVQDTVARQVVDATSRIPKFVLPVVRDRLRDDRSIDHAALMLAAWCACIEGGVALPDRAADQLRALARADHDSPGAFLAQPDVFGDLTTSVRLRVAYQRAKRRLQDEGPIGTVRLLVASPV